MLQIFDYTFYPLRAVIRFIFIRKLRNKLWRCTLIKTIPKRLLFIYHNTLSCHIIHYWNISKYYIAHQLFPIKISSYGFSKNTVSIYRNINLLFMYTIAPHSKSIDLENVVSRHILHDWKYFWKLFRRKLKDWLPFVEDFPGFSERLFGSRNT